MTDVAAPRSAQHPYPAQPGFQPSIPDAAKPDGDVIDQLPTAGPLAGRAQPSDGASIGGSPAVGDENWTGPSEAVKPGPVRVNLLPPQYRQRLVLGRAKRRTVLMLAGSLAVVLLLTVVSFLQATSAASELAEAQDQRTAAQAEVAKYAEVPKVAAELAAIRTSLTEALGSEVLFSSMLTSVAGSIPDGVSLTALGFDLGTTKKGAKAGSSTSKKSGALPVNPNAGTVTFTGTAPNLETVSLFLDQLERNKDFQDVALTSASRETGSSGTTGSSTTAQTPSAGYTFEGTAALSKETLSNRYAAAEVTKP